MSSKNLTHNFKTFNIALLGSGNLNLGGQSTGLFHKGVESQADQESNYVVVESERQMPDWRSPLGLNLEEQKVEKKNLKISENNEDDPYDSYRSGYIQFGDAEKQDTFHQPRKSFEQSEGLNKLSPRNQVTFSIHKKYTASY